MLPSLGRADLIARWYELARGVMPAMAREQHWPITRDHCFMRVCLDAVFGAPWTGAIARPAIQSASLTELAAVIEVAEGIVAHPNTLDQLNQRSLEGRRGARSVASGRDAQTIVGAGRKRRRGRQATGDGEAA